MGSLVMGIDTGSTYTDAVLMDYESKTVLATAKRLTTRYDLSVGIMNAIDGLAIEDASKIALVSVSTTLATNSVVEGKNEAVALVLIGYDPELVTSFNFSERFATTRFEYFRGGHDVHSEERERLDTASITDWVMGCKDRVSAIAVSAYFSPLNPAHEEAAREAIAAVTDLPVVLGHQLSNKLDSVQRATTAALNASLISLLRQFIRAVQHALQERGIQAPLMVVRGDGSLMKAEVALDCPLETVASGPAASAIGATFLSGRQHALVVDIGGTTTDISLVDDGQVNLDSGGAVVGGFRTAVRSAHTLSIGLGGDSIIHLDSSGRLVIGPERVTPLSFLASAHPSVCSDLQAVARAEPATPAPGDVEFWYLTTDEPPASCREEPFTRKVVAMLHQGPRTVTSLLGQLGLFHRLQLPQSVQELLRRGVIARAALTPTDLLHITGQFTPGDRVSAEVAASILTRRYRPDSEQSGTRGVSQLIETVLEAIGQRIAVEVVEFLSGARPRQDAQGIEEDLGAWLMANALHPRSAHLETTIRLKCPLVGIGAPAYALLGRAARMLGTELILPQHFAVGNAVGAVAANVVVNRDARVFHSDARGSPVGYYVQAGEGRRHCPDLQTALALSRSVAKRRALEAATAAGAVDPEVVVSDVPTGAEEYLVEARAFGNPRLARAA